MIVILNSIYKLSKLYAFLSWTQNLDPCCADPAAEVSYSVSPEWFTIWIILRDKPILIPRGSCWVLDSYLAYTQFNLCTCDFFSFVGFSCLYIFTFYVTFITSWITLVLQINRVHPDAWVVHLVSVGWQLLNSWARFGHFFQLLGDILIVQFAFLKKVTCKHIILDKLQTGCFEILDIIQ